MNASFLNEFKAFVEESNPYHNKCVLFDDVPVLIHSNDGFYLNCFLEAQMKMLFDNNISTVQNVTYNDIEFEYNNKFVIFDMKLLASQFANLNAYLKFISKNQVIFNMKKYVIFKNVHCMNKQYQQCFVNNVTQLMRTHSVVCTSLKLDNTIQHMRSHFCFVKVYLHLCHLLEKYAAYAGMSDCKEVIQECVLYDKDVFGSLLALHTQTTCLLVEQEIQKLINSIKKTKNITVYIAKVRAIIYKLLIYNLSHHKIATIIWNCVYVKFKKKRNIICTLAHETAKLDHHLLFSSKALYHYELFFIKMFKIIRES